jgi:hypothetical protein
MGVMPDENIDPGFIDKTMGQLHLLGRGIIDILVTPVEREKENIGLPTK